MTHPRPLTPEDLSAAKVWFTLQGWPEMQDWMLSTTGYCIPGLAAVWLYTMNSGIAWMEHLVANPLADRDERRKALKELALFVEEEAKRLGYKALLTMTNNPGASRVYEQVGYATGDKNMVQYVRRLV